MGDDWRRGYDYHLLKAVADRFRVSHQQHIYGAFGGMREADIATALAQRGCRWDWTAGRSAPRAVALHRVLLRDSTHHDFTGAAYRLPAGTVYVYAVAGDDPTPVAELLAPVTPGTVVETYAEDAQASGACKRLGLHPLLSKVTAGASVKVLWGHRSMPALPVERWDRVTLKVVDAWWLTAVDVVVARNRLAPMAAPWAQHYSSYNMRQSWTALALRGYSDDPTFIMKPTEMSRAWQEANPQALTATPRWTALAVAFPELVDRLTLTGWQFDRVRLMRVRAKDGALSRHADITDREAGTADGKVMRLHVPLATNPGVVFHAWDHLGAEITTHLPEGALCYLDQRKPHAVDNTGDTDRVHLVVDAIATRELRALVVGELGL